MPRFSANLGYLWTELPLPDAIRAAAAAGFDAVECHWPYDEPVSAVNAALADTGLPMLSINTRRGIGGEPTFGLLAVPGRETDARALLAEAVAYAAAVGARYVHAMGGCAEGPEAHAAFIANLAHGCALAGPENITLLIEPLNPHDVPGYFLRSTAHAQEIIAEVGQPNLKLMFDCYHVGRMEGDVLVRLAALLPIVGHIQFAAVPDRGAPDHGDLDYGEVFAGIDRLGWTAPLGAEYRTGGPTEPTLGWLREQARP